MHMTTARHVHDRHVLQGQCGEVWKGIRDGRVVAVKRLNLPDLGVIPHVLEDLIDEARLAM